MKLAPITSPARICPIRRRDHRAECDLRPDSCRCRARLSAKIVAGLTIFFGLLLVLRGSESPPYTELAWTTASMLCW